MQHTEGHDPEQSELSASSAGRGGGRHERRRLFWRRTVGVMAMLAVMGWGRLGAAAEPDDRASVETLRSTARVVTTDSVEVDYRAAGEVSRAVLWFTRDGGDSWQRGASAAGGPVAFAAESDGLYGLYVVLHNEAGPSSPDPGPGTRPQQWFIVDRSPPLVRLLRLRPDRRFEVTREVEIRWSVEDAALSNRPVSLHFRTEQTKQFRPIADSLPAIGTFRWIVPEDAAGRVEIKVTARDRAGFVGKTVGEMRPPGDGPPKSVQADAEVKGTDAGEDNDATTAAAPLPSGSGASMIVDEPRAEIHGDSGLLGPAADAEAAAKARKLYDLGTWHRLRGEDDLAMARYEDALSYNPALHAARHDHAALLVKHGELNAAEDELQTILAEDPKHHGALKTQALIQAKKGNYRSAGETLQKLLLLAPDSPEVWLHFGDVAMFTGQRTKARQAWAKAAELDAPAGETRQRAEHRLEMYSHDTLVSQGAPDR